MEVMLARRAELDLTVYYCARTAVHQNWAPTLAPETFVFLDGWSFHLGQERPVHVNPGVLKELTGNSHDLIVTGGYSQPTTMAALLWAKSRRLPYGLRSESNLLLPRGKVKRRLKQQLLKPLLKDASVAFAIGSLSREYLKRYGVPEARIFTYPNTPDVEFISSRTDRYRADKDQLRQELGIVASKVILFVGKLVKRKRPQVLVQALHQLETDSTTSSDLQLIIIGEGPERGNLLRTVRELGTDRVSLLGYRKPADILKYYAISDLFVLPSAYETWGVVVNEAMASRLPVVVTEQVGAAADVVERGMNGYVVPVDDAEALCHAMKLILMDSKLQQRMGRRSFEIIREWNYDRGVRNFLAGVESAVGYSRSRS
jgi:glycosyltransferase involved in cell wall biosynthesis